MSTGYKVCTKCGEPRPYGDYHRQGKHRRGDCKDCVKIKRLKHYEENKERIKADALVYYANNRDRICSRNKEWRESNPHKVKEAARAWRDKNRQALRLKHRAYYLSNKDRISSLQRKRYEEKIDEIKRNHKAYRVANRDRINQLNYKRLMSCPVAAMAQRARNRVCQVIRQRGFRKEGSTTEIIGCDWDTLKRHIESQFCAGMSWDNRELWHVDHIIPLGSAKTKDELKPLLRYTNLQPLWAEDNLKKGDKIPYSPQHFGAPGSK